MTDAPRWWPVDERVLGPSPFPADDPRTLVWRKACRLAGEQQARIFAEIEAQILSATNQEEYVAAVMAMSVRLFDLRAEWMATVMVHSYDDVEHYIQALTRLSEGLFVKVTERRPEYRHLMEAGQPHLEARIAHWEHRALSLARFLTSRREAPAAPVAPPVPQQERIVVPSWQDVTIEFTSEHRVQIGVPGRSYSQNYGDMGFEDRRNTKPKLAWVLLTSLSRSGVIVARRDPERKKIEKQIQALRKALIAHFNQAGITVPTANPLPWDEREGCYRAAFRISRRGSFEA